MEEENRLTNIQDAENKETLKEIPIEPFRAICEQCVREVTTYVRNEFNLFIFPLIILVIYFYGLVYGIPILAITVPLCKNIKHCCPNCLSLLHERSFYPVQLKENYFWIQYGKCVIIVKKYYIFLALFFILLIGCCKNITHILNSNKNDPSHNHDRQVDEMMTQYTSTSDLTWDELIKDCGAYVMVENSAKANEIFNRKYYKRTIEWKGYFISALIQNFNPMGDINPEHVVNINIRMIPSESIQNSDLYLSLDFKKYQAYLSLLKSLVTGDPIKFKASLESVGNEWRPHHLHLIHLEKTTDFVSNEHKVVLFQGIKFNITGHLKMEKEIEELVQLRSKVQDENVGNKGNDSSSITNNEN